MTGLKKNASGANWFAGARPGDRLPSYEGDAEPQAVKRSTYYCRRGTDVLAAAVGSVWYTFVDAVSGFNQIRNTKRVREVLAIVARSGEALRNWKRVLQDRALVGAKVAGVPDRPGLTWLLEQTSLEGDLLGIQARQVFSLTRTSLPDPCIEPVAFIEPVII